MSPGNTGLTWLPALIAARMQALPSPLKLNAQRAHGTRFGQRVVYGGHVMSLARALSFNGLGNACILAAINAGSHVNPVFPGDTIYAWTEIVDKWPVQTNAGFGALRLRTRATKDLPCESFPKSGLRVVLDLDYSVLMPR